jgi:hypothetical protein
MINNIALLRYNSHRVHIAQNTTTGRIHCFKYNQRTCDFRVFEETEDDACADYILTALPTFGWGFVEDSESDSGK